MPKELSFQKQGLTKLPSQDYFDRLGREIQTARITAEIYCLIASDFKYSKPYLKSIQSGLSPTFWTVSKISLQKQYLITVWAIGESLRKIFEYLENSQIFQEKQLQEIESKRKEAFKILKKIDPIRDKVIAHFDIDVFEGIEDMFKSIHHNDLQKLPEIFSDIYEFLVISVDYQIVVPKDLDPNDIDQIINLCCLHLKLK